MMQIVAIASGAVVVLGVLFNMSECGYFSNYTCYPGTGPGGQDYDPSWNMRCPPAALGFIGYISSRMPFAIYAVFFSLFSILALLAWGTDEFKERGIGTFGSVCATVVAVIFFDLAFKVVFVAIIKGLDVDDTENYQAFYI